MIRTEGWAGEKGDPERGQRPVSMQAGNSQNELRAQTHSVILEQGPSGVHKGKRE